MRPLPKHLRPRYRYLGVEIESWPDADVDRGGFERALRRSARGLLGEVESARVDLAVLGFAFAEGAGEAVVRCRRGTVTEARAALACVDAVDGRPVGVRVRGVSGTVRACEEKYIGKRPEAITEKSVVFGNADGTAVVRDGLIDVRADGVFSGATELDFE